MKIIVSGGLGNQMFQYALYVALKDAGRKVILDTSLYSYLKMHNGFELRRCFGVNESIPKSNKYRLFILRLLLKFKPRCFLYNDLLYYNNEVFRTRCKYLNGYWQSEKYFKQIENKIYNVFQFKNIDTLNLKLANKINSINSVSIHFRRGDYIGNSLYSNVCMEEYYMSAISKLTDKLKYLDNMTFFVFSDDTEFAKHFMDKFNYSYQIINHNKGVDSYKDMYLMSQCKHNIIANSSFSWWGAWLNKNQDKKVIAPKHWFNNGIEDTYKDIVPEKWICV